MAYLVLDKNLNLIWSTFYAIGQILIVTYGFCVWSYKETVPCLGTVIIIKQFISTLASFSTKNAIIC